MWSITLTDYLQFLIMTVGIFFLLLPLTIAAAGGFSGMSEALPTSYFDLTAIGWQTIFTYFLLFFFGLMIGQDIWQRVFTARSPEIARWGSVAAGVYCLLYALAGALASMAAGSVVVVALMIVDGLFSNLPIIYGMLVSLVVFVVVSLLTPRPSEERMRAWERRLEGPGTPP
jgi:SSS family solute:Na+ symporter